MDTNKESIGRFRIAVPPPLAVTGRTQNIYGVQVWTEPAQPGQWAARLAAIGPKLKSQPTIASGVNAVWYQEGNDLLIDARRELPPRALWARRGAPPGKQAGAEELVRTIMASYRTSTSAGFCLGGGALVIDTSLSESVRLGLAGNGMKVEFATRTVQTPDLKTFMDVNLEREFANANGGSLTVLREQERTIAGLEGKEIWILVTVPQTGPQLRYTWHFPGEPKNASHPAIDLLATASGAQQAALTAVWETILPALELVPVD